MMNILLWIWRRLRGRCPKCGSRTSEYGFGEFCVNIDCDWVL